MLLIACGRTELGPGRLSDVGDDAGAGGMAAGGAPVVAGSAGRGGGGFAGTLVAIAGEPAVGTPEGGQLVQHAELLAQEVRLTALAAASDGRVAVGGAFRGRLDVGGPVLASDAEGGAPFVLTYDANGTLLWARKLGAEPHRVSGLAFTADGGLVVQGSDDNVGSEDRDTQRARLLDADGVQLRELAFGAGANSGGKVVVDPTGQIHLGGTAYVPSRFGASTIGHFRGTAYLMTLSPAGAPLHAEEVLGEGCTHSAMTDLAIDPDGSLLIAASCWDAGDARSAFVQKRDLAGARIFEKHFTGSLNFNFADVVVTVDSMRRIVTGGGFQASFSMDGEVVSNEGDGALNSWLAGFGPQGNLLDREVFASHRQGVLALAADPLNQRTVLVGCDGLRYRGVELAPQSGLNAACVLKLKEGGDELWGRLVEGWMQPNAMISDASGYTWVAGEYSGDVRFGEHVLPGNATTGGLLLRLSP